MEKNSDQNKKPSRVAIENLQSTSIIPEPRDYVAAIYLSNPCIRRVEEINEEGERGAH